MSLTQVVCGLAQRRTVQQFARAVNAAVRPPRPLRVNVGGYVMSASTLDRFAALWILKWRLKGQFDLRLWEQIVEPGMIVADVGANLGFYTLTAARRVGPGGHLHSFEPDPENYALLAENVAANGCRNVTVHRQAAADVVGTVLVYQCPENRGDHRIYPDPAGPRPTVSVPVTTLDAAFENQRPPDVVKLDVQGVEWRVLGGMKGIMADNPHVKILTEFWPWGIRQSGGDPLEFLATIRQWGLDVQCVDARHCRLDALTDRELMDRCGDSGYEDLLLSRGQTR